MECVKFPQHLPKTHPSFMLEIKLFLEFTGPDDCSGCFFMVRRTDQFDSLAPPARRHGHHFNALRSIDVLPLPQVVSSFDGSCSGGSRLGVLCRPPSGWQPNLEDSSGGYLFLVDSHAQAVTRRIKLGGESLAASVWHACVMMCFCERVRVRVRAVVRCPTASYCARRSHMTWHGMA